MKQIPSTSDELGGGVQFKHRPGKQVAGRLRLPQRRFGSGCARPVATLPASSQIIFLYDGFTASFNTPEWEHRHPTLSSALRLFPARQWPGAPRLQPII